MKLTETKQGSPLFNYIVVRPVDINPYVIRKTQSGLLLSSGQPLEMSQETGQMEKLKQRISFGVVVDAGSECKAVQIGDEVYFDVMSTRALPVLDLGYLHMHEQNILYVVRGEGDLIAEALEFEQILRQELDEGLKGEAEYNKQRALEQSLQEKGITLNTF
jgi:co-chaperonin GroES (HSP10)